MSDFSAQELEALRSQRQQAKSDFNAEEFRQFKAGRTGEEPKTGPRPGVDFGEQGAAGAVFDQIVNGITFGYGPRIVAAEHGLFGSEGGDTYQERYDYAKEREMAQNDYYSEKYPILTTLGFIGGAVGGSVAALGAAGAGLNAAGTPIKTASTTLGRMGQGAGVAAVEGAIYGSSQGEGFSERAFNAALTSAVAAPAGAAGVYAFEKIAGVAQRFGMTPASAIARFLGSSKVSAEAKKRLQEIVDNANKQGFPDQGARVQEIVEGGRNIDPAFAERQALLEANKFPTDRAMVTGSAADERLLDRGAKGALGSPEAEALAKDAFDARQAAIATRADDLKRMLGRGELVADDAMDAAERINQRVGEVSEQGIEGFRENFRRFENSEYQSPRAKNREPAYMSRAAAEDLLRKIEVNNDPNLPGAQGAGREAERYLAATDPNVAPIVARQREELERLAALDQGFRDQKDAVVSKFLKDTFDVDAPKVADMPLLQMRQTAGDQPELFGALLASHSNARLREIAKSLGLSVRSGVTKDNMLLRIAERLDNEPLKRAFTKGEDGAAPGVGALIEDVTSKLDDAVNAAERRFEATIPKEFAENYRRLVESGATDNALGIIDAFEAGAQQLARGADGIIDQGNKYDRLLRELPRMREAAQSLDAARRNRSQGDTLTNAVESVFNSEAAKVAGRNVTPMKKSGAYAAAERKLRATVEGARRRGLRENKQTGVWERKQKVSLKNLQRVRAAINEEIRGVGKGVGAGQNSYSDRRALSAMLETIDDFMERVADPSKKVRGVYAPPEAIEALRKGLASYKVYVKQFRVGDQRGVNKRVFKALEDMAAGQATAEDVARFITLNSKADRAGGRAFAKQIKEIFGKESEDFMALRQGVFSHLVMGTGNKIKTRGRLANDLADFFQGPNRKTAQEIFGDVEGFDKAIGSYIDALRLAENRGAGGAATNVSATDISRETRSRELGAEIARLLRFTMIGGAPTPGDVAVAVGGATVQNMARGRAAAREMRKVVEGGAPQDPPSVVFPATMGTETAKLLLGEPR
ncbi:MAG: hypothetical protein AAFU68_03015 [Pseudomonadota bacterium]